MKRDEINQLTEGERTEVKIDHIIAAVCLAPSIAMVAVLVAAIVNGI